MLSQIAKNNILLYVQYNVCMYNVNKNLPIYVSVCLTHNSAHCQALLMSEVISFKREVQLFLLLSDMVKHLFNRGIFPVLALYSHCDGCQITQQLWIMVIPQWILKKARKSFERRYWFQPDRDKSRRSRGTLSSEQDKATSMICVNFALEWIFPHRFPQSRVFCVAAWGVHEGRWCSPGQETAEALWGHSCVCLPWTQTQTPSPPCCSLCLCSSSWPQPEGAAL